MTKEQFLALDHGDQVISPMNGTCTVQSIRTTKNKAGTPQRTIKLRGITATIRDDNYERWQSLKKAIQND